jgi:hypothetical protein
VKALTVQQPWAECIARGAKLIENRSRPVSHRGPLSIHASLRISEQAMNDPRVQLELTRHVHTPGSRGWDTGIVTPQRWQRVGVVVAIVDLVDCHPAAGCCKPWGDDVYNGKPAHHLVLEDARRLVVPFLACGRLGLWDVELLDPEVIPSGEAS